MLLPPSSDVNHHKSCRISAELLVHLSRNAFFSHAPVTPRAFSNAHLGQETFLCMPFFIISIGHKGHNRIFSHADRVRNKKCDPSNCMICLALRGSCFLRRTLKEKILQSVVVLYGKIYNYIVKFLHTTKL
jgi:hypothetical protein